MSHGCWCQVLFGSFEIRILLKRKMLRSPPTNRPLYMSFQDNGFKLQKLLPTTFKRTHDKQDDDDVLCQLFYANVQLKHQNQVSHWQNI